VDEITVHHNKDVDIKIQNLFAGVVLHKFSSKVLILISLASEKWSKFNITGIIQFMCKV